MVDAADYPGFRHANDNHWIVKRQIADRMYRIHRMHGRWPCRAILFILFILFILSFPGSR